MAAETFRIEIPVHVDDQTDPGASSATRKINSFDKAVQKSQDRLDKMNRTKYEVALEALDKASGVVSRLGTSLKGIAGKTWRITMGVLDKATAPLRGIISILRNPILQAGAMIGVSLSTADAIKTFADFQSGMNEVFTLTPGISEDAMQNMKNDLKALAKESGTDLQETVSAAYQAISAGVDTGNLSDFMGTASKAAIAGVTDLETAVDGLTSVTNAYGKDVMSVGNASDLMFTTVKLGKTTFGELSDSLYNVVTTAVGAGVAFSDISAALAAMTAQGTPTSVATTQLRQALVELSKSGTQTDKTFRSIAGKSFKEFIADGGDLQQALQLLNEHANSTGKGISDMFSSVEAGNAATSLAVTGATAFDNAMKEMANSAGATDTAYKTADKGINRFMARAKAFAQVLQTNFMEKFDPIFSGLADWFEANSPEFEKAVDEMATSVSEKLTELKETIGEFTSGEDWQNADIWGKIAIAWDKIVAEPFNDWWSNTGKAWLTQKMQGFGKTLGSGITAGLLAILGIDVDGALADGKTVGGAFIDGFKSGFDTEKITEALKSWAEDHKGAVAALGVVAGGKLLGGIAKGIRGGQSLVGDIKSILGIGSGKTGMNVPGAATYTTSTMSVTAGVVNVYGNGLGQAAQAVTNGGLPALGGGAMRALPALGGGAFTPMALPRGATAAAGGLTSAGGLLGKLLQLGSTSSVVAADGTLLSVSGGVGGTLGGIGTALGSGATTAAGAAAAGAGGVLGGIGGLIGLGAGLFDIFKGTKATGKDAQDAYSKGGTKIGMVGAGAGIGAAIGSAVPVVGTAVGALVGAGVGGIGALGLGDKIGQALSDALDEGGWLNNMGQAISTFFTETLPDAWNGFWEGVGNFFTETVPYALGYAIGKVQMFFTETIPKAWNDFWGGIGTFFTETIPTWWENVKAGAINFFTVTIPAKWTEFWDGVGAFFTETIPAWWEDIKTGTVTFFTETLPAKWTEFWNGVGNFFTETIPTWWGNLTDTVSTFFTETIPKAWNDFWGGLWDKISGWFSGAADNLQAGYADATGGASAHAWGGIMTKPHLGLVAEDGAESIIPLSPSKRSRGLDLWEQTGQALGVHPYADGGIVGDTDEDAESIPISAAGTGGEGPSVHVTLQMAPEFVIEAAESGMDEAGIIAVIKAHIKEMVDDISDELAERIARIFANMPVKGGA